MKMRLTTSDLKEIIYERNVASDFKTLNGIEEQRLEMDFSFGRASMLEYWFEGVHLNEGMVQLHEDIELKVENTHPLVEMHFSLSGDSYAQMLGKKEKFLFNARHHNVFYMPHFEGYLESGKQKDPNHIFEVHLTEDYFKKLVNRGCPVFERFAEGIEKQEMAMMSNHNMQITSQMDLLIQEIIHCQRKGTLKRLFVEAKVLELLILQVEQFESAHLKKENTIKRHDLDKIHHAKFLIEQNIGQPLSLLELAHQAGLNEFKLKKGFKELFGTTVFGHLHDLRMEEARRLLLDQAMSVGDIADHCGYEHVQHFSTAFKKRFGVTPIKYRN